MVHVKNGLYFERVVDGSVHILKKESAALDSKTIMDVIIDKDTWASIVATVCVKGENSDTFRRAESFHEIGRHEYPTKI